MNAYLDASIILSEVLHQQPRFREWHDLVVGVTSELTRVECLRTLDRLRIERILTNENLAAAHERLGVILKNVDLLRLDRLVLARAAEPLPTTLGTLDSIHLATARIYRQNQPRKEPSIYFATFDRALAAAARATSFRVLGATPSTRKPAR